MLEYILYEHLVHLFNLFKVEKKTLRAQQTTFAGASPSHLMLGHLAQSVCNAISAGLSYVVFARWESERKPTVRRYLKFMVSDDLLHNWKH